MRKSPKWIAAGQKRLEQGLDRLRDYEYRAALALPVEQLEKRYRHFADLVYGPMQLAIELGDCPRRLQDAYASYVVQYEGVLRAARERGYIVD